MRDCEATNKTRLEVTIKDLGLCAHHLYVGELAADEPTADAAGISCRILGDTAYSSDGRAAT